MSEHFQSEFWDKSLFIQTWRHTFKAWKFQDTNLQHNKNTSPSRAGTGIFVSHTFASFIHWKNQENTMHTVLFILNRDQLTLWTLKFMKYIQLSHPWTKEVEIHPIPKGRKRLECFRNEIFGKYSHILLTSVRFLTSQKYAK